MTEVFPPGSMELLQAALCEYNIGEEAHKIAPPNLPFRCLWCIICA